MASRSEVFAVEMIWREDQFEVKSDGSAVVKDVKLNSNRSLNRTLYPDPVLEAATPMYEGVKVFSNHDDASGSWYGSARKREAIVGRVKNVRWPAGGGGHRADVHVLPSWVDRGIVKDMKADPMAFGFSHVVWVETSDKPTDDGCEVVKKINSVESVDLVSTPATTKGIFESKNLDKEGTVNPKDDPKDTLIETLTSQLQAKEAESVGNIAAVADLKSRFKAVEERNVVLERESRDARIETALKGLPENVTKFLRDAISPLPTDVALKIIESTAMMVAPVTSVPGSPRSEGSKKSGSTAKAEIRDEDFIHAMSPRAF